MATGRRSTPRRTAGKALPAKGRKGKAPVCPYPLGEAGSAWWKWAWKTPQAAAWTDGDRYAVARRALLEDRLAAAAAKDKPSARTIGDLSSLCLRTDESLGLTPKGMKSLGWTVDGTAETADPNSETEVVDIASFRAGLSG